jgi:hypothetical protein
MVGEPMWEQERPVSAPAVSLSERPSGWWPGSGAPDKRSTRETGESGAGVGAAQSTDEGGDTSTLAEGRGRT